MIDVALIAGVCFCSAVASFTDADDMWGAAAGLGFILFWRLI